MYEAEKHSFPRCCEIWMCDLGNRECGVQSGYRPVLVLSNNRNNLFAPTINVAPMTTKMNKRSLPVHVELWDYEPYGLLAPSTILMEQLTTVHVNSLDRRIGKISDQNTLDDIREALEIQIPISP